MGIFLFDICIIRHCILIFLGQHRSENTSDWQENFEYTVASISSMENRGDPIFLGRYPGTKPDTSIYVVKVNDKYYATYACVVKNGLVHLRCRKYRKEKCKFRLTLRSIYLHDPGLPGYFEPKNFELLPGKHGHICPGYNSEFETASRSRQNVLTADTLVRT